MIRRLCLLAAVASTCLAAQAASPAVTGAAWLDVLRDCAEDGGVDRSYTLAELRGALKYFPADLAEYSECMPAIAAAMRKQGREAKGERSAPDSPRAREDAGAGDGAALTDGGSKVRAGDRAPRPAREVRLATADEGVAGSLLSGAEAIGKAPLEVVGAAAGGRLGIPGYVWGLLVAAALLGLGVLREYRSSSGARSAD